MPSDSSVPVDELVLTRKRVHSGEHLFRAGDPFDSLYVIRTGIFKIYALTKSGRIQVTAFPMAGDLAGLDSIGSRTYAQNLVALEVGEVCVVPYARLQELIGLLPRLQHQLNRIMSREIVREQKLMTLLGTMEGEAKVAEFLLSLARPVRSTRLLVDRIQPANVSLRDRKLPRPHARDGQPDRFEAPKAGANPDQGSRGRHRRPPGPARNRKGRQGNDADGSPAHRWDRFRPPGPTTSWHRCFVPASGLTLDERLRNASRWKSPALP